MAIPFDPVLNAFRVASSYTGITRAAHAQQFVYVGVPRRKGDTRNRCAGIGGPTIPPAERSSRRRGPHPISGVRPCRPARRWASQLVSSRNVACRARQAATKSPGCLAQRRSALASAKRAFTGTPKSVAGARRPCCDARRCENGAVDINPVRASGSAAAISCLPSLVTRAEERSTPRVRQETAPPNASGVTPRRAQPSPPSDGRAAVNHAQAARRFASEPASIQQQLDDGQIAGRAQMALRNASCPSGSWHPRRRARAAI
jgi:hypothetical protein